MKPFWRLKDVGHQPGYFVAKDLKMLNISGALAPRIQADGLTPRITSRKFQEKWQAGCYRPDPEMDDKKTRP